MFLLNLQILFLDGAPKIFYATGDKILSLDLESGAEGVLINNPAFATSVDYHYEKGLVFWADSTENKVQNRSKECSLSDYIGLYSLYIIYFLKSTLSSLIR